MSAREPWKVVARVCVECGTAVEQEAGRGRPRVTCGEACAASRRLRRRRVPDGLVLMGPGGCGLCGQWARRRYAELSWTAAERASAACHRCVVRRHARLEGEP